MSNINKVTFNEGDTSKALYSLWQWDYGQVLQIEGLNLPAAVEIHFSLQETGGEAEMRMGVTKDGITEVEIPRFILWKESKNNYSAFAFIYPSDETSGETLHKIEMIVKARPKPKQEDENTAKAIIAAVNKLADLKVDKPSTAEVDQVIAVSEIDEEGKPIAFKAVAPSSNNLDSTLTVSGKAADANAVGVALSGKEPKKLIVSADQETNLATHSLMEIQTYRDSGADVVFDILTGIYLPLVTTTSSSASFGVTIIKNGQLVTLIVKISESKEITTETQSIETLPNPHKLIFKGAVEAEYDGSGAVTVTIPSGTGGSTTERIEKDSADTDVTIEANKLYIFPEMSELNISLADITDTSAASEFHFIFQSGETATTLSIPDTVNVPSSFSIEASKIYEISILESCLTYQSWEVS